MAAAEKKAVSKWFRVFTEGHTTDGRTILASWIKDIVDTFDPKKYGARVWLEHIRGVLPDSPFGAYGDVTAVKSDTVDGKLTLFAKIEPTAELIAMNKKKQKLYTSVEIDPDFAKSGKCYLTGLAVTDSPASLGTDMLEFSAKAEVNPLASRKQRPENLFTAAVEFELELEEEQEDKPTVFSKVTALLGQFKKQQTTDTADIHQALEAIANEFANAEQQFSAALDEATSGQEKLQQDLTELQNQFAELKTKLEQEEDPTKFRRSPAAGGDNIEKTDC